MIWIESDALKESDLTTSVGSWHVIVMYEQFVDSSKMSNKYISVPLRMIPNKPNISGKSLFMLQTMRDQVIGWGHRRGNLQRKEEMHIMRYTTKQACRFSLWKTFSPFQLCEAKIVSPLPMFFVSLFFISVPNTSLHKRHHLFLPSNQFESINPRVRCVLLIKCGCRDGVTVFYWLPTM